MDARQLDALWFSQQPVPGAAFRLNDPVAVVAGEHAGRVGAVISLERLEPEPVYLVEFGDDGASALLGEHVLAAAV